MQALPVAVPHRVLDVFVGPPASQAAAPLQELPVRQQEVLADGVLHVGVRGRFGSRLRSGSGSVFRLDSGQGQVQAGG